MTGTHPLPDQVVLRALGPAGFFFHLNDPLHAGRLVYYCANVDVMRQLIGFRTTPAAVVELF